MPTTIPYSRLLYRYYCNTTLGVAAQAHTHDVTASIWQGASSICKVTLADQRRAEIFDFAEA
jgi:hypothetical protein